MVTCASFVSRRSRSRGVYILATPDQAARQRNVVGTLIGPALREGQVLYVRTR